MLIDLSYFFGTLSIPQLETDPVKADVQNYIEKYEPEYLRELLGYALYDDYATTPNDARIQDIINGKEYTDWKYRERKWNGLKFIARPAAAGPPVVTALYASPCAHYVYCKYREQRATQFTGSGEKVVQNEGSVGVSPWDKICVVWNEMVDMNRELMDFMRSNNVIYPEYNPRYGAWSRSELFRYLNRVF